MEAIQQVLDDGVGLTPGWEDSWDLDRRSEVAVLRAERNDGPPTVKAGKVAGGRQEKILLLSGETRRPQLEEAREKELRNSWRSPGEVEWTHKSSA